MRFKTVGLAMVIAATVLSGCATVRPHVDPVTGQIEPGYGLKAQGVEQIAYAAIMMGRGVATYEYGKAVNESARIQERNIRIQQQLQILESRAREDAEQKYYLCLNAGTDANLCRSQAIQYYQQHRPDPQRYAQPR